jgi:hypothetical protein
MQAPRKPSTFQWLKNLLMPGPKSFALADRQRAVDLIAAIDAGGIPLNPARVNAIGRTLGLEVSRHARVEDTIARIRAVLNRLPPDS